MSITANKITDQKPISRSAKRAKPVLYWAALGAVILVVIVLTVGQWVISPGFKPAPVGLDPLPDGIRIWITALEVFFVGGTLLLSWLCLIKPWIKTGHISWDGMFLLALVTLWYQDPMDNYFNFTFTYNAHFHNMSSWAPLIPGWVSPRAENFAEPYFLMGSFFIWVFLAISISGCWLLKKFTVWLPNLSIFGHAILIFLIFGALDFLMESLFTHTGIFAYVAVYSPLSFWAGTPRQFPVYESVGVAAVCLGVVLIRHYRDDKGNSFAEKGVQQLSLPVPAKRLLCFLALVGAVQVINFFGFFVLYEWFALKADSFAKYPSYQLLQICGKGTPYACPTGEVPMPKRTSLAIGPDDPRLSAESLRN